jgi:hypothetical protein
MFDDTKSVESIESLDSKASTDRVPTSPSSDREQLQLVSRRLRQTKRMLLLKSVATPTESIDQLRDIFLKISLDESNEF